MRSGKLRERIGIYKETNLTDTNFGSPVTSSSLFCSARAEVRFISGKELLINSTVSNATTAQFIMRFREGIDETMQVEYRGDRYNIQYLEENRKTGLLKITGAKILN